MHKTYLEAMNPPRKAHRYALEKAGKEEGAIDWVYTHNDWTSLKAGDTGDEMLVTVRIKISKDTYLRHKKVYERMQKARLAKENKDAT